MDSSTTASEPGSGTGLAPTWGKFKILILDAIKQDHQPIVFEHLLTDVRDFMTEI